MDPQCVPLFLSSSFPTLSRHRSRFLKSRAHFRNTVPSLCALPPHPDTASSSHPGPHSRPISTRVAIVPGKFESLHIGHRFLAQTASKFGNPTLLSFSGMSSALRWKPRLPVVADVERDRLLRLWSNSFGVPVSWQVLPFEDIRDMSPSSFLRMMVDRYSATAIVCGPDWKFGKGRAGDVNLLREIGPNFGLEVSVVQPRNADGIVSSTRIRNALTEGNVQVANILLGRYHRVVGYVVEKDEKTVTCGRFVNMLPAPSEYHAAVCINGSADVVHTSVTVVESDSQSFIEIPTGGMFFDDDCELHIDFVSRVQN